MIRCAYCHAGEELARLGECTFCGAAHHVECYVEIKGVCAACGRGCLEEIPPEPQFHEFIPGAIWDTAKACCMTALLWILLVSLVYSFLG